MGRVPPQSEDTCHSLYFFLQSIPVFHLASNSATSTVPLLSLFIASNMADDRIAELIAQSNAALAATLANALQQFRAPPAPTVKLARFLGHPRNGGEPTISQWLEEFETYARQAGITNANRAMAIFDHLGGCARDEVLCHPEAIRLDYQSLVDLLTLRFGPTESVPSLGTTFHARMQMDGETLADYSRVLMRLHSRMEKAAVTRAEGDALALLRDNALKEQFVRGVRDQSVRYELRRIALGSANQSFLAMRDEVLSLLGDHDEVHRTVRVRGAEAEPNSVDKVILQVLQSQQQLQSQVMQLASQQCQTASQLQAVLDQLAGQPRLPAPVMPTRRSVTRPNPRDGLCFFCKEHGHFIRECPKKRLVDSRRGPEQSRMQGSAHPNGSEN